MHLFERALQKMQIESFCQRKTKERGSERDGLLFDFSKNLLDKFYKFFLEKQRRMLQESMLQKKNFAFSENHSLAAALEKNVSYSYEILKPKKGF